MEMDVRQGSKSVLCSLNIVFQFILGEICANCEQLKVRLLSSAGCEWSHGHLEFADDLSHITHLIKHAKITSTRVEMNTRQICHGNTSEK